MPTIDELSPAAASADEDLVAVSQGGVMRRVTRAQMLSGMQAALAVAQGGLLGRSATGVGGPETITVGRNLQLQDGVISARDGFSVTDLPLARSVQAMDMVAVSQSGRDAGAPVGMLLAGLAEVPGLDLSAQAVRVAGGDLRALSEWLGDAAPVEAFGAAGDGVTDDTAAIGRALASGRAVRFGPRTYVLNGQFTVTQNAELVGVPGRTVLRRTAQAGGAWIAASGARFAARGIVFDAGSLGVESWGVLVGPECRESRFEDCWFRGATGASLGSGLVIEARDGVSGASSKHVVRGCEASNNAVHGIWVQATSGAVIEGCVAHDNGQYGICLDFNDPAFLQKVRHGRISGCRAYGNRRGISVGNYNETNLEPPRWGNANPDVIGASVSGNRCHDNLDYGIAVAGLSIQVSGNLLEGNGSGILLNAAGSIVSGNMISGPGQYGIDAGGSVECDIDGNLVQGFAVGINPGGSRNVRVAGNGLSGNVWAITVFGMETDGHGAAFGIASTGLTIEGNRIQLKDGSGGGVLLADAPQGVAVVENRFWGGVGSSASQALWAHTDQYVVRGNTWNNQARMICNPTVGWGLQQVQVPEVLDEAMVTSAPLGVGSIVGQHQASVAGQVTFIKVTNCGAGYSRASVSLSGAGQGASAVAYVRDGAVVGISLQSGGSGYGGSGALVTISGDGTGAQAMAGVGLPVPEERRLRLHCNGPVRFKRAGSNPFQDNWTGVDVLVPQASTVDWVGTWGGWQAVSFPLADYVSPSGDGGLAVRSVAGDVVVRPAGGGRVRVSSDGEPVGFASLLGRGSPEGVAAAPVGSDYRNLDGGSGLTLWVKRAGSGTGGWSAVA